MNACEVLIIIWLKILNSKNVGLLDGVILINLIKIRFVNRPLNIASNFKDGSEKYASQIFLTMSHSQRFLVSRKVADSKSREFRRIP